MLGALKGVLDLVGSLRRGGSGISDLQKTTEAWNAFLLTHCVILNSAETGVLQCARGSTQHAVLFTGPARRRCLGIVTARQLAELTETARSLEDTSARPDSRAQNEDSKEDDNAQDPAAVYAELVSRTVDLLLVRSRALEPHTPPPLTCIAPGTSARHGTRFWKSERTLSPMCTRSRTSSSRHVAAGVARRELSERRGR